MRRRVNKLCLTYYFGQFSGIAETPAASLPHKGSLMTSPFSQIILMGTVEY